MIPMMMMMMMMVMMMMVMVMVMVMVMMMMMIMMIIDHDMMTTWMTLVRPQFVDYQVAYSLCMSSNPGMIVITGVPVVALSLAFASMLSNSLL